MRFLGNAQVFDVTSFSDATKTYRVTIAENPDLSSCDCPAFVYRRNVGPCKHITHVEFNRELGWTAGAPKRAFQGDDIREVAELFNTAMTWVDNDAVRAGDLVEAYLRGRDGAGLA